jgi:signal transduction histidine kinase
MSEAPAEDEAILATQMRALRRLRPAIEHELRSGLNSVVLNIELLAAQVERLEALGDVEVGREVEALREMVADLREGSGNLTRRIEMTMRTVLPSEAAGAAPADLVEMVQNLGAFLAFEARLLGVRCQTVVPPEVTALPLPGRRSRVQAALLALAAEALRFAPSGGALRLSLAVEGEWAEVEIEARPLREERAADEPLGIEAIAAALGAHFESDGEGESHRLRLRFPRRS